MLLYPEVQAVLCNLSSQNILAGLSIRYSRNFILNWHMAFSCGINFSFSWPALPAVLAVTYNYATCGALHIPE